ncbi:MAG: ribosomal protein [Bacteroidota bacterium]|jgi:large subunit ribosomal protein L29
MKASELKDLSVEEIQSKIQQEVKSLEELKFNHVVTPLDNPLVIKAARKNVARLKTELNKRK